MRMMNRMVFLLLCCFSFHSLYATDYESLTITERQAVAQEIGKIEGLIAALSELILDTDKSSSYINESGFKVERSMDGCATFQMARYRQQKAIALKLQGFSTTERYVDNSLRLGDMSGERWRGDISQKNIEITRLLDHLKRKKGDLSKTLAKPLEDDLAELDRKVVAAQEKLQSLNAKIEERGAHACQLEERCHLAEDACARVDATKKQLDLEVARLNTQLIHTKTEIGRVLEYLDRSPNARDEAIQAVRQQAVLLEQIIVDRTQAATELQQNIDRNRGVLEVLNSSAANRVQELEERYQRREEELKVTWNEKKKQLETNYQGEFVSLESTIARLNEDIKKLEGTPVSQRTQWVLESHLVDMKGLRLMTVHSQGHLDRERNDARKKEEKLGRVMLPLVIDSLQGIDRDMNVVISFVADNFSQKTFHGHLFLHVVKGKKGKSVQLTGEAGVTLRVSHKIQKDSWDKESIFSWEKNTVLESLIRRIPLVISDILPAVAEAQPDLVERDVVWPSSRHTSLASRALPPLPWVVPESTTTEDDGAGVYANIPSHKDEDGEDLYMTVSFSEPTEAN